MDDYEPEAVQRSARALDGEARWQDISDEKIVKYYDAFTFLNAEGMRYYVAPFLLYDLAHPDSVWGVGEVVLGYLNWKRRLVDYEILNDEQKAILARYLKMRSERSDDPVYASEAKNALSVYWHAYLP